MQIPSPDSGADGAVPSAFERLQAHLLARALIAFPEPCFEQPLREALLLSARAAIQAGSPMLLLPELFREVAIATMLRVEWDLFAPDCLTNVTCAPASCNPAAA